MKSPEEEFGTASPQHPKCYAKYFFQLKETIEHWLFTVLFLAKREKPNSYLAMMSLNWNLNQVLMYGRFLNLTIFRAGIEVNFTWKSGWFQRWNAVEICPDFANCFGWVQDRNLVEFSIEIWLNPTLEFGWNMYRFCKPFFDWIQLWNLVEFIWNLGEIWADFANHFWLDSMLKSGWHTAVSILNYCMRSWEGWENWRLSGCCFRILV